VAVAPRRALAGPLVAASADQSLHVGLHQQLHDGFGGVAKEVVISGLLHQLGQRQSVLGQRVLLGSG